eukprot:GHUV01028317.1.p1 GENE.GHUV01028317.1~~GHUV01028317.1.p1  ORF type:complete len:111 (-),score=15.21 GHUV01028317.1:1053-1346(-)
MVSASAAAAAAPPPCSDCNNFTNTNNMLKRLWKELKQQHLCFVGKPALTQLSCLQQVGSLFRASYIHIHTPTAQVQNAAVDIRVAACTRPLLYGVVS